MTLSLCTNVCNKFISNCSNLLELCCAKLCKPDGFSLGSKMVMDKLEIQVESEL